MSTEEQDQILGRLIREKAEYKRQLAGIDAELRRIAARLKKASEALLARCEAADKLPTGHCLPPLMISMDDEAYIQMETLNRLLKEQDQAYEGYAAAEAGVARFNP